MIEVAICTLINFKKGVVIMKALAKIRAYLYKLGVDTKSDWEELVKKFRDDGKNLPNRITEVRLIFSLLPGILLLVNQNSIFIHWFGFGVFVAVALTDKIDGYLARKLNQVTELGKFLDPAVDKILISFTVIAISIAHPYLILPIVITLVCEILVPWLTFRARHRDVNVAVSWVGKARMFLQCVAIAILFLPLGNSNPVYGIQRWAMIIAAAMNVASLLFYIWVFYAVKDKINKAKSRG